MNRLSENLKKAASEFMRGRGYRQPLSAAQILSRLHLPNEHKNALKKALDSLVHAGLLISKGKRYDLRPPENNLVKGVIRVHPRGFGFVQPGSGSDFLQDIFIPKHLTQHAVDGDLVEAIVNTESMSDKGPEGKVISILERSRTHISGIVRKVELDGDVIAYVPLLGTNRRVVIETIDEKPLRSGDRIVGEVLDWGTDQTETVCRLSHTLGHLSDASVDTVAAIEQYELRADFPIEVIREAQQFGTKISTTDLAKREDFRDLACVTIDPETAKDFDDALTVVKTEKGYLLRVHIADVSYYVKPGSSLDKEARERCNSTYFPGTCLPMLPPCPF